MTLRFVLDEQLASAVAERLRRRGIDVVTPSEAGLRKRPDEEYVTFGLESGRVIVTQDADFVRFHYDGVQHAGIA